MTYRYLKNAAEKLFSHAQLGDCAVSSRSLKSAITEVDKISAGHNLKQKSEVESKRRIPSAMFDATLEPGPQ